MKKSQKRLETKSELQHRTWLPRNPRAVVLSAVTWYFLHFSVLTPSSDMATPEGATRHGYVPIFCSIPENKSGGVTCISRVGLHYSLRYTVGSYKDLP